MADNTTLNSGTGGDVISTDVITTLNGGAVATGEKSQRVKVGWGVDGTFNDTNASNPLPVVQTGTPTVPTGAALDATLTGGTAQTKITNGTQVADTIAGDTGQNSLVTVPARKEVTFTTTTAQVVASTDVSNYRSVAVQINTQGTSATVTFQASNDNTNWVNVSLMIATAVGNSIPVVSTTSASPYVGPLHFRYFRLSVTGISAGTTGGVIEFMSAPSPMPPLYSAASQLGLADNADGIVAVASATALKTHSSIRLFDGTNFNRAQQVINATNSIGTGITAVGNLAQFDDVAPTAITENQFGNVRMSANRNQYTTIRDAAGNERGVNVTVENGLATSGQASAVGGYSFNHITTSTTTLVKTGAGTLNLISVNSKGTVASTTTVYDNTTATGTIIAVIDSLNLSGPFQFGIAFATGLTIVTTGTVAPDLTVSYK